MSEIPAIAAPTLNFRDTIPRFAKNLASLGSIFARTGSYVRWLREIERRQGSVSSPVLDSHMIEWAGEMLSILNVKVTSHGEPSRKDPALLVGNHIGYVDIPVLMFLTPTVFIAKKQLSAWPVIGQACRTAGTLFVDRDSKGSRRNTAAAIAPFLQRRLRNVVIFPSGTTSLLESQPWRWGAFQIALEHDLPVQPFRIRYEPARRAAFLLKDAFLPHLWKLLDTDGLGATVEFHPPVRITDPQRDSIRWWRWSREGLA